MTNQVAGHFYFPPVPRAAVARKPARSRVGNMSFQVRQPVELVLGHLVHLAGPAVWLNGLGLTMDRVIAYWEQKRAA